MTQSFSLALLYTSFAVVATICNILAQDFSSYLFSSDYSIFISIIIGTAVGLLVKYSLDKKYIFKYQTKNLKHDQKIFLLYVFVGGFTTLIFWGFEFGFNYIFETKEMRYLGGIIGLMIGYICKYYLDKKYVFVPVQD